MKLFILILTYLSLVNSLDFTEARQKLLKTVEAFYNAQAKLVDETLKSYILSQKMESRVYIKTLKYHDLNKLKTEPVIYDNLKTLFLSEKPNTVHQIEKSIYGNDYENVYGVAIHDGETMFFMLFTVKIRTDYKYKYVKKEVCNVIPGGKSCAMADVKVTTLPEEKNEEMKNYLDKQAMELIKKHIAQIKELNGKVLYSLNEGDREKCEGTYSILYRPYAYIVAGYNQVLLRIEFDSSPKSSVFGKYYPSKTTFGESTGYNYNKIKGDMVTAFLTDDGYLNFMTRDQLINSKKLIYKKKLFDPTGSVLPYRFIITNEDNFMIYDNNYKIIGSLKNMDKFKSVDFAWPDDRHFNDEKRENHFCVKDGHIYFSKGQNHNEPYKVDKALWYYYSTFTKAYSNCNLGMSGYLIVDKNGILKHINYELNKGVDWQVKPEVKGNGPYSLGISGEDIVLKNGDGEIYWTSAGFDKKRPIY